MASPTSTTAPVNPYANPTPGGSGGAAAAQILAPVNVGQGGPIIQIDQKKVPIFHGEPGKDGIEVREWTRRIDSMKAAFNWTEQATYENARAALFGYAADVMLTKSKKSISDDFTNTWTWMKKKMLAIFGNVNDLRAMIDILQSFQPKHNINENMLQFACKIDQEFEKIASVMDKPNVQEPPNGHYTRAEAQALCEATQARDIELFNMGYMINMLPPLLRTKVLEKKPTTVAATLDAIEECQKLMLDEKRPTGLARSSPTVHLLDSQPLTEERFEQMLQAVENRRNQRNQGNNRFSRGNNKKGSDTDRSKLKCSHCQRTGHGVIDCFKRIEDELPCYNQKGEPYFPATDKEKREKLLQRKNKINNVISMPSQVSDDHPSVPAQTSHVAEDLLDDASELASTASGQKKGSVFPIRG